MLRVCSMLVLLAMPAFAQQKTRVYLPEPKTLTGTIFSADGKLLGRRSQKSREPIIVIDTIRLASGVGTLTLRHNFGNSQHAVAPTSEDRISVQISPNTTDTPKSYGWSLSNDLKTLSVKSSDGSDSSKVTVTIIVR